MFQQQQQQRLSAPCPRFQKPSAWYHTFNTAYTKKNDTSSKSVTEVQYINILPHISLFSVYHLSSYHFRVIHNELFSTSCYWPPMYKYTSTQSCPSEYLLVSGSIVSSLYLGMITVWQYLRCMDTKCLLAGCVCCQREEKSMLSIRVAVFVHLLRFNKGRRETYYHRIATHERRFVPYHTQLIYWFTPCHLYSTVAVSERMIKSRRSSRSLRFRSNKPGLLSVLRWYEDMVLCEAMEVWVYVCCICNILYMGLSFDDRHEARTGKKTDTVQETDWRWGVYVWDENARRE